MAFSSESVFHNSSDGVFKLIISVRLRVIVDIGLNFGVERVELGTGIEHSVAQEVDNEAVGTIGRQGIKT